MSGICKNQLAYDAESTPLDTVVVKAVWANEENPLKGYRLEGITLSSPTVLLVSYYDSYDFLGKNGIPDDATTTYCETAGYGKRYGDDCKGQQTGILTALFTDREYTGFIYSALYYDDRYRVVQRKGNNGQNGTESVYTAYNFEGSPTKEKHVHSAPGQAPVTEVHTYTYDLANRLLKSVYQLNDKDSITLVDNIYDEVGRLFVDRRNGVPELRTNYSYNLRSWLKGVSSPLFSQTLNYQETINDIAPCYNGNISSLFWRTAQNNASNALISSPEKGYGFTYDGLSRLKDAVYGEGTSLNQNRNRFNEQITGYDKMGNILGLLRYGQTGTDSYGLIDNLNLTYNGNQLESVYDNATNSVFGNGMEFKDNAHETVEYAYDKNGNLTKDLNKNITGIQYNILNLPSHITFADGNSIVYEYAADGSKVRTTHTINDNVTSTVYCGNAVYENGSLTMLLNESGYYSFQDNKFHFYIKDHQGNVRVVADETGKVDEVNDYYPFGGLMSNACNNVQLYKYNDKELDRKGGLDWYDYGARHYDAMIGRWCAVDSLAEKYNSFNVYNYCGNNPIRYVDPNGNGWDEAWPFLKNSLSVSFSIGSQANADIKVMGVNVGLGVNGGSMKIGDGPLTVEKGLSIGVGIFNAENYTRAYELDSWTSVRESGYTVGIPLITEDHKKTETFDSTGRYFEKTGESNTIDTDYTIGVSASVILGADISIDLSEIWNFFEALFK
ncbi:RHS repeat-associated core domain-containing protein [Bacteroides xylanisolvens]|nr:RHS repeat-associated core domain-containing protein [Bacteroides xylanisolvens]